MGASKYSEIGKCIADELRKVPDIGQVHEFQRYAPHLSKYLDLFRTEGDNAQGKILGWIVTREAFTEGLGSAAAAAPGSFTPAGVNRRVHTFLLFGVMGLEDGTASEQKFQDLVEAVCDHFRSNAVLQLLDAAGGRRVATLERLSPPAGQVDIRTFGSVLCHAAELRIQAAERIVRA